jgi:uncharacterized protein (TIGR02646 family)
MRPVCKWSFPSTIKPELEEEYNPYSEAKPFLEENLGGYCSYCEKPCTDEGLHVEHIQPKATGLYPNLQYKWSNFLLSCQRCNGTDNKGDKDVILNDIHLPHINNTFRSIKYGKGGTVAVNPALPLHQQTKAQALIDLVGLDKNPAHPDYLLKDKRWSRRKTAWDLAERYLKKYNTSPFGPDIIVDLAKGCGFWSVWMTVFENIIPIRDALVNDFHDYTYKDCYNKDVDRN